MNSIEFLKEKLHKIYNENSYLEIKYEFRSYIKTHIIEVKPIHCFEKDKEYILKQISIEEEFEQLFPNEEVLFMSENILIQIQNPILELGVSSIEIYFPLVECQSEFEINENLFAINEYRIIEVETDNYSKIPLVGVYYHPPIETKLIEPIKKDSEILPESFFLFNFAV